MSTIKFTKLKNNKWICKYCNKILSSKRNLDAGLFGKTDFFLIEAGVGHSEIPNSLTRVNDFMESKGYKIFDITDLNRPFSNRRLHLIEVVYVNCNSEFNTCSLDPAFSTLRK